ncbi:MAG: Holliday junction ATP-dependent DNA helicase RuvA [Candidatus Azambacteria bacterium GW2011_GWA2_42_9]|uniref:Holliday junction branch migration complex subunit RuvA n=3 Tax=Candidatus Azamiibacteriota TaxID=1752741 RepID=A0A0G1BGE8_9BACT|nr:MAG: Holliday junction ATP-dependent DNA helicase RuvA [Candidatus Azambacteria bacterium GW2011_GWB1_42_17]KKS45391.1 MAG: Holliday junction ATP-dependent DNA helicase RuvA [Candidatus Azambacteria bacterium GW2011_GWA1_42_19]KKS75217.1 MAG: Holliday junction ATP-dependent DNA helicase RuvA [Candidatus Azambacteria bacterium GW2011_GWA2_42_9]KKS87947.1 MAG: Holliday junction ATP-dependent DNA helicase RuvA [Parcubacteria group bacterium GW2011_GWC1_43_11]
MISYLEGKIIDKNEKFFVINTGGVGYRVFSHEGILKKIPDVEQNIGVWTHLYVREDALDLYGFLDKEELDFFETLISISGIGPKSALGILEVAPVASLKQAIVSEDETFFTKVSGVGKKTAQRLILELKNKLAKKITPVKGSDSAEMAEAIDALVGLGYKERDARKVLQEIPKDIKGVEAKVKAALKQIK